MTPTARRAGWLAAALVLTSGLALAAAPGQAPDRPAADDAQDFVFLAEARPVLVRLHVRVDGKPLQAAWDDFVKYLFDYLDVNGDGVLSKEEAARAPAADQVGGGGFPGQGFGGLGGTAAPSLEALDADKDGQVSLAELAAYYRKHGLAPLQVQVESADANPLGGAAAYFAGTRPEPPVAAVREAVFALLDADRDGKLTREELAAAPAALLRLDEDDDEMITPHELAPNARPAGALSGLGKMMARAGGSGSPAGNSTLVLLAAPGEAPADLVRRLQERYGPKSDRPEEKKLSRKDLGLDEATFGRLDANGDGVLDAGELAAFVKRAPDLELVLRLGKGGPAARVELVAGEGRPAPLAGRVSATADLALLDLGVTRVELRPVDEDRPDRFAGLLRQQYVSQFRQADADGNGYVDEKEARNNRLLRGLFKAMDRDGDGKLTEKELLAYLDAYRAIQARARAGSVSLVLSDQSRGLFDLLDADRDGRLSVREMRQAPQLLERLDRDGKGYLTREDVPRSYRLTLRRGPAGAGGAADVAAAVNRYLGGYRSEPGREASAGPLWFRKMDRNRDGDVSRKEFPFSDEEFRKIDTDGDGLISLEEAEKADARFRKEMNQEP